MKVHEIKIWESNADAILSGEKTFEIRNNYRLYQKGDRLKFYVVENGGTFPVRLHRLYEKEYEITYVYSGFGLKENYVILAIKAVKGGSEDDGD